VRNKALSYARSHQTEALAGLQELLRIPSISTLPEHKTDVESTARWLAAKMTNIGLHNVKAIPTAGYPVVYGEWLQAGPGAPTLLIYGHYDVQPVDPRQAWQTPPFEPTVKGDDLFARGAADDKGQLYIHLAAVEAYLKTAGRLPLNVKFVLEGEEEVGSLHLADFILAHRDQLQAEAALISDTGMIDPQTPVLVTGIRGLVYLEISMRGSRQDLHSGMYGGAVENPLNALARMLASLRHEDGRISIPGFYDAVRELTPTERQALINSPTSDQTILAETGAPALWGETGYSVAERIGVRPTLDVHGIKGGFTGQGPKTVIPAAASAKLSMRLVPDQKAQAIAELVSAHIQRISPKTMEVSIEILSTDEAAVVDVTSPAIEAAALAFEHAFNRRPLFRREGGSLPVVAMFDHILNLQTVMMGFGLPDDNLHAPNEKFHLPNFYQGIETAIHYYSIFAGR
jgi:acetylornithine deacetylase/succinyl-diaminopimelate desuccinylase-like protein